MFGPSPADDPRMALFSRGNPYDRMRLLERAARERRRGRLRKAIALYREVIAVEPENGELHRRIAPLLARSRDPAAAWSSYRCAARALLEAGFAEKAIGLYREATELLPREPGAWRAVADLELARARTADAKQALVDGRRRLKGRRARQSAALLLASALELDPRDLALRIDLVRLRRRLGQRGAALNMLDAALRWNPDRVARIRFEQLRTRPRPDAAWRWLRALAAH